MFLDRIRFKSQSFYLNYIDISNKTLFKGNYLNLCFSKRYTLIKFIKTEENLFWEAGILRSVHLLYLVKASLFNFEPFLSVSKIIKSFSLIKNR